MAWDTTVDVLDGAGGLRAGAARGRCPGLMRIAVLGAGLIGGSIGQAARQKLDDVEVVGHGRSAERLERALAAGAIDRAAGSLAEALEGADACFCCAPVGALTGQVRDALAAAPADCVVTDVGSVKRTLVETIEDERFVGGHPIAGAETSGVEHARPDLFEGALWYLTPTAASSGVLYERLHRLIVALGARPVAIDATTHDSLLAVVSHLPHVLANVLVAQAASHSELPRIGPELPRRHPRGRRQHRHLDRHLPGQPGGHRRGDRRHRRAPAGRGRRPARRRRRTRWPPGTRRPRADRQRLLDAGQSERHAFTSCA